MGDFGYEMEVVRRIFKEVQSLTPLLSATKINYKSPGRTRGVFPAGNLCDGQVIAKERVKAMTP